MLKFNTFLFFLLIISLTTGCIIKDDVPQDESSGCNNANFTVDQVTGTFSVSDETALPEKFTLTLTARLRSNARIETALPRTQWAIGYSKEDVNEPLDTKTRSKNELGNKTLDHKHNKVIHLSTDGNGVLLWTETFDWAYAKQSQWIRINRHIKGLSNAYTGTCEVPLVINPWLQNKEHADIQIADYRPGFHKGHETLTDRVAKNNKGEYIDGIDFLIQKQKEEQQHKVDIIVDELTWHRDSDQIETNQNLDTERVLLGNAIEANLKYSIKDIHGNIQDNQISEGNFKLKADLLIMTTENSEAGNIQKYLKMNKSNHDDVHIGVKFDNDTLTSDRFDWTIPYENYRKPIALYLRIEPQGDTANRINAFEGIFPITNHYTDITKTLKHVIDLSAILKEKYRERINADSSDLDNVKSAFLAEDYDSPKECLEAVELGSSAHVVQNCISREQTSLDLNGFIRAGWTVRKMDLRFFNMEQENWLSRRIKTNVETSIFDPYTNRSITNFDINIEVTDLSTGTQTTTTKETDTDGKISFTIPTQHNWYKRQRYFLKLIRFYTDTNELGIEKIVAINPWDYGFTHGFEVNHPEGIRTTCFKESDYSHSSPLVPLLTQENQNHLDLSQEEAIQKLFCSNPLSSPETTTNTMSLTERFKRFKKLLQKPINLNTFFNKFISSKTVKIPAVNIHLVRSINKFPTYLIDDSLNREIYYNVRIKLSPTVVRYDDIARGQQNKGPIRDGVYILQMAILKNDQERSDGTENMVLYGPNFNLNSTTNTAGTRPLFSCSQEDPTDLSCITEADWIIEPTNIPILIRGGMVKKDTPIRIPRKYLLFANSKNILVFRILPADPKSIVCKEGRNDCTTITGSDFGGSEPYENAFDWQATIKNIKPADPKSYDIHFYTYKTPFIPSLWNNWNITHELNTSFEDLANQYLTIQINKILEEYIEGVDNRINNSLSKYTGYSAEHHHTTSNPPAHDDIYITELNDLKDKVTAYLQNNGSSNPDPDEEILSQTIQDNIILKLNNYLTDIEQDSTLTEAQKTKIRAEIQTEIQNITEYTTNPELIVKPDIREPLELTLPKDTAQDIPLELPLTPSPSSEVADNGNESSANSDTSETNGASSKNEETNSPSFSTPVVCADTVDPDPDSELQPSDPEQIPLENSCVTAKTKENTQTEDLSKAHIEHFTSKNTLCAINIDSPSITQLDNSCGDFTNTEDAQRFFIEDLNAQIQIINAKNTEIKELEQTYRTEFASFGSILFTDDDKDNDTADDDQDSSVADIQNAFQHRNYRNSLGFKNKLKDISQLKLLDTGDLKEIIQSKDIENSINNNDEKMVAFLHALCGFWFSKFLSDKYITSTLLLNGIRNTVKNSFYYRMGGKDDDDFMTEALTLNQGEISRYKAYYIETLEEQKIKGTIDDLHEWVDNPSGYGFDADFNTKLRDIFQNISQENPLKNEKPSWENQTDNTEEDNTFQPAHYLNEAIQAIKTKIQLRGVVRKDDKDYHPFRKCISNPSHFFGFEKKIIVGKIGDNNNLSYSSEETPGMFTLNIAEEFLISSYRDKGASQNFHSNLGTGIELLAALPLLGFTAAGGIFAATRGLLSFFPRLLRSTDRGRWFNAFGSSMLVAMSLLTFSGIVGGLDYQYNSYDGTGSRKMKSVTVIQGMELLSERTPIKISLNKYHDCMVIRPRFSAFESPTGDRYDHIWNRNNKALLSIYEKAGILLCVENEENNSKTITETYYYIYPKYPISGVTIDPSSFRNKGNYTISLRGQKSYEQFIQNLSCYITNGQNKSLDCGDPTGKYKYLFSQNIEFAQNLKKGFQTPKMFHLTGDIPGVYSTYSPDKETERQKNIQNSFFSKMIRWFTERSSMDMNITQFIRDKAEVE